MKEIIITSQKQLDELSLDFKDFTYINIKAGTLYNPIIIKNNYKNSSVVARENSSVEALGNSSVEAWENSSVVAWENSSVEARGNSSVIAWENSSVEAWENSSVEARGNSSVVAWENSSIKVYSEYCDIKKAMQESVIIIIGIKNKPKKRDKTSTILYKKISDWTKNKFLDLYEKQVNKNKIILYKSINPNTDCDFYTGKINYKDNTVVNCPDWNADENILCGNGLHLSPTPQLALSYNKGKIKVCEVDIKDFVIYSKNITKVRCKKVKVIGDWIKE